MAVKLKSTRRRKKTDIAWLAGFWEGEGTAAVYNRPGRGKGQNCRVSLCQKEKYMIDSISDMFPGGTIHNAAGVWHLNWNRQDVIVEVIKNILPFCRHPRKIEQLEKVKVFCEERAKLRLGSTDKRRRLKGRSNGQ